MADEIVVQTEQDRKKAIAVSDKFSIDPQNLGELMTFSNMLANSDLVPKDYKGNPGNVIVAIQLGAELGVKPIQALQNIAVINGRPTIWGDLALALVRNSGLIEYIDETDDGDTATCRVKRRGEPERIQKFSMKDAARAGLANKEGPWKTYPQRMRQMRARSWALRDLFGDVLKGIFIKEEVEDYQDIPAPAAPPPLEMPKRKSEIQNSTSGIPQEEPKPISKNEKSFDEEELVDVTSKDFHQQIKSAPEVEEPGANG